MIGAEAVAWAAAAAAVVRTRAVRGMDVTLGVNDDPTLTGAYSVPRIRTPPLPREDALPIWH